MTLKTGDIIQNRYRIVRLVGQGGFGAVYRAWDINVSQPVALKENLGVEAEAQRQFEREATLLAGLRHPHLPRVTDHFIVPGQGQYPVSYTHLDVYKRQLPRCVVRLGHTPA